LDFENYEKILQFQLDSGVDGIVVCGTTGESPTLSHQEKMELIEKTVKFSNGKMKVIAGTGNYSTDDTIRDSLDAKEIGVDGLLLVNPYYNKPTQEGLFQHFKKTAEQVKIPIMLYNIPGRSSVNVNVDTIKKLSDMENIVSIKEAAGSLSQMMDIIHACHDEFTLLSGDDNLLIPCLAVGGKGVVSVLSNIFPKELKNIINLYNDGSTQKAKDEFYKIYPLCKSLFLETNPIPIKKAMEVMGYCKSELRLPLTQLREVNTEILKKILEKTKKIL
jgi:4-hydroxy-tetrahydrodipicolinate synthase